jgi:hypothetical protein
MSDGSATKGLRERLTSGTEDRLGKALTDLFDNPLLGGALGRAADAREKATQAQELAMGALNLPSAADVERLTRRLRSVSQRLEGIEDGVHRIGRSISTQSVDARLGAIEEQLKGLSRALAQLHGGQCATGRKAEAAGEKGAAEAAPVSKSSRVAKSTPAAKSSQASKSGPAATSKPAAKHKPATKRKAPAAKRAASGGRAATARGGRAGTTRSRRSTKD